MKRVLSLGLLLGLLILPAEAAKKKKKKEPKKAKVTSVDYLAVLADTHVGPDPAAEVYGQKTAAKTRLAVALIAKLNPPPKEVMVVGDMAMDKGSVEEYPG